MYKWNALCQGRNIFVYFVQMLILNSKSWFFNNNIKENIVHLLTSIFGMSDDSWDTETFQCRVCDIDKWECVWGFNNICD